MGKNFYWRKTWFIATCNLLKADVFISSSLTTSTCDHNSNSFNFKLQTTSKAISYNQLPISWFSKDLQVFITHCDALNNWTVVQCCKMSKWLWSKLQSTDSLLCIAAMRETLFEFVLKSVSQNRCSISVQRYLKLPYICVYKSNFWETILR